MPDGLRVKIRITEHRWILRWADRRLALVGSVAVFLIRRCRRDGVGNEGMGHHDGELPAAGIVQIPKVKELIDLGAGKPFGQGCHRLNSGCGDTFEDLDVSVGCIHESPDGTRGQRRRRAEAAFVPHPGLIDYRHGPRGNGLIQERLEEQGVAAGAPPQFIRHAQGAGTFEFLAQQCAGFGGGHGRELDTEQLAGTP